VEPGIRRSDLPWRFKGNFFLLTYHGPHSRLVLRSVAPPDADVEEDDDESYDALWDSIPTTDVMFVDVRRLRVDVNMEGGLEVRVATDREVADILHGIRLAENERLLMLGVDAESGWVVGSGVWWTESGLPLNAPSPLLADLDFSVSDFSWEKIGSVVYVDEDEDRP
jgi:hypothetical protein